MADLTPVAADVMAASAATTADGVAGEAITAGQVLYNSASKAMKADDTTAAKAAAAGIALNNAALDQPIKYITRGGIDLGCLLVVGTVYGVSDTAGGICPIADLGSADFVTILGIATTTSNLELDIKRSGVAIPA